MITKLIFEDGTQVSSGALPAVMSFSLTRSASAGQELNPGACCAAMAQLTLLGLDSLPAEEFHILRTDGTYTRDLGLFRAEKPERSGRLLHVTAYDRLCLLDKDLSDYSFTFPCSLYALTQEVCHVCGLTLKNEALPSGDYPVQQFQTAGVTGRQVLQWVAAIAGGFWRATADGQAEFAWYEPKDIALTASDYYENSLSMASFEAEPITKVQLKQTTDDVGVVFPNITGGAAYVSVGNPLFSGGGGAVAEQLFQRIGGICYTPCQVTVPETDILPGDLITVEGKTVAVMTTRLQNGRLAVESTGSRSRAGSMAVNEVNLKNIAGKVLELRTRVDGLSAENRSGAGELARLELTVEGLQTAVSKTSSGTDKRLTELEQTADALKLRVEQTATEVTTSTGYSFGAEGLMIARSGTEMVNRLDHTGMLVERAGQTILEASHRGVTATDVTVQNYLHIGSSRFEEYGDRTACFYVE